jgi:hypothetical protein
MERTQFKVMINASPAVVWDILWNDATYPLWTAPFSPGSRAETDWEKGSKVLFLNGENKGMVSTIAEKIPNEFMSFEHLGMVSGGVEDMESAKTQGWAGAKENYTLTPVGEKTELTVDMDMTDEFKDYFLTTWPKALEALKDLAE